MFAGYLGEIKVGRIIKESVWLKAFFHSFSQVVFLENCLSGILIFLGIAVFSYEVNDWNPILLAVIGVIIGNIGALILGNDKQSIKAGLFGFNPVLVGIAAAIFFHGIGAYLVAILGSILVTPLTLIINRCCARFDVPGFTMPFIVITWLFILVSFQVNSVAIEGSGSPPVATLLQYGELVWEHACTKGIGEIYLLDSVYASILIYLAFVIDRWRIALKLGGIVVVTIAIGMLFKVDIHTLNMGLYTYNSLLVYLGMETCSKINRDHRVAFGGQLVVAILCTCLIDYALPTVLRVFALPTLTFPFVVVTWMTLYFEQVTSFHH